MTLGERLFPMRIRTMPPAESFGGVLTSVVTQWPSRERMNAQLAEAIERLERPHVERDRDMPRARERFHIMNGVS